MKHSILTFSILLAMGAFVYAGPEAYSGKDMKQVTPAAVADCPNWSGFYIGGFGGYNYGITNPDLDLGGGWDGVANNGLSDRDTLEARGSRNLNMSGAEAGGLLGYNWQFNKWVVGLEGSGGYLWQRNSNQTEIFSIPASPDTYDVTTSFKSHYLATFGPRIGYAVCRWLPYVTGGLAVGDLDFSQQLNEHNLFFREGGNHSETNVGWMVGGGLQYAITNHWSARVQYQYIDLGDLDFNHHGTAPFQNFTGNSSAELKDHNATFALIYKF
jgi:outer membrane immunogenic protein